VGGRNRATREGGGFWVKAQKPSHGGSFFANDVREVSDTGSGVHGWVGKRQSKEVGGRNRATREGVDFGSKPRNRAAGAHFSQTTCGRFRIQVVECVFGWGNASLRRWGAAIGRRVRGRILGQSPETEPRGLVFRKRRAGGFEYG
jgi:hypothetical protein